MTLKYKIMRRLTSLISALEFGEEFLFGFRLILAGFHHFVTDFAGAGKELKKFVALVPADVAFKSYQVFDKALDKFKNCAFIIQQNIAPHGGV